MMDFISIDNKNWYWLIFLLFFPIFPFSSGLQILIPLQIYISLVFHWTIQFTVGYQTHKKIVIKISDGFIFIIFSFFATELIFLGSKSID
jgi:hypothetical protein